MAARSIILNLIGNDRVSKTLRGVSRELDNASDSSSRLSKAMSGLDKVGKGTGLATAAAGALALAQAAAPAAGASLALAPALLGVKAAAGLLKVGLYGVSDAMSALAGGDAKKLDEALKKLAPNARSFVREAQSMRKEIIGVQQASQNALFAGLDKDLDRLGRTLLPTVRRGMVAASGALNGIAREAARTAATPWFRGELATAMQGATGVIRTLTGAVAPAIQVVTRLTVAGLPLLQRMTGWAVAGVQAAAAFLSSERGARALTGVVQAAGDRMAQLVGIGVNLGIALGNIVRAAGAFTATGGDLLGLLVNLTGDFAAWTKSADGQQRLNNVFALFGEIARDVAQALPLLLGPIGATVKILMGMPAPVRGVVSQMLAWSILIGVVGQRLQVLTGITVAWKAAMISATAIKTAATATAGFVAGLRSIEVAMAADATVATRLGAALRAQVLLWRQQAAAAGVSTARYLALAVAQKAVAAATAIWSAVQWTLNAALDANPIGVVIMAIAALVAIFVIAWNSSSTFRAVVIGTWNAIKAGVTAAVSFVVDFVKNHWKLLLTILLGPLGPAFLVISTFWRQIWSTIQTVWQAIAAAATWAWTNVLQPIFNAMQAVVGTVLNVAWIVLSNTVKTVWILIQIAIKLAWAAIKVIFNAIQAVITTVLAPAFSWFWSNVVQPVWSAIAGHIRTQWAVMRAAWSAISSWLSTVLAPAFKVFKIAAGGAWSALSSVIQAVWNSAIKPSFEGLKVALGTVKSAFKVAIDAIGSIWGHLGSIAKTPVNFVIGVYNKGIVGLVNKLADFAGVKTRLTPIPALARGGTLDNPMPVAPMMTNGPLAIVGEGRRAYPEYVIPTDPQFRGRAQSLWAAAGRDLGGSARKWLTGPQALGGEGLAFARGGTLQALASGGIIGDFVQGVKDFTIGDISKAASGLLGKLIGGTVPGTGTFRDMIAAVPGWIKDTVLKWIKGKVESGVGGPAIQRGIAFARAQVGKPYVWGAVGPNGYDCSGFMSALTNVIQGKNPFSRRFTTFSFTGASDGPAGFKKGLRSGFQVGVTNAGVGHMAGTLGGINVESSGSQGVHMGPSARGAGDGLFGMRYGLALARGGVLRTATYDRGGLLQPGYTLAYNGTGKPEPVVSLARGGFVPWRSSGGATTTRTARGKAGQSLLSGINSGMWSDPSKVSSWFSKLFAAIQKNFWGSTQQKLQGWAKTLQTAMASAAARAKSIADRIAAARDYATNVANAAKDYASLQNLPAKGSVADITTGLEGRAQQIQTFADQINKLQARGLAKGLLQQIIGMGAGDGSALASMLLGAGNGVFGRLNAAQQAIDKAAANLGNNAADALFDSGKGAAKGFLTGLYGQQAELNKLMDQLGRRLADGVRRDFGGGWSKGSLARTTWSKGSLRRATYDSGGMLLPGWTLAYNGTGRPEPIFTSTEAAAAFTGSGRGNGEVHVNVGPVVVRDRADADMIANQIEFRIRAAMA
ncbi:hypothetical protein EBO15_28310 [Actinomadura harenae]|uniref:NlpC/P60 domain-containing protein n=1 Tax=Actinomadura harenae TaxID=2483351 RepID=A0A3M2LTH4_9ACTN|nr:hypothetical protein [Actinomadura harenae]RMI39873.1 hypothetical protein EBO15_28310 [Actinomadura harenae]